MLCGVTFAQGDSMREVGSGARRRATAADDAPGPGRARLRAIAWGMPALYLITGAAWIAASDRAAAWWAGGDAAVLARLQGYKDGVWILATALLLGLLLRPLVRGLRDWRQRALDWRARHRELFHAHPVPMWTYDPDTARIAEANPAAGALLGWPCEALRGMDMGALWQPEAGGAAALAPEGGPGRLRLRDGSVREVELRSVALAGDDGRLRLAVLHDRSGEVHARHALEQARQLLDEREQQLRELVRMVPDGLLLLAGQRVAWANPACAALFGRPAEALEGQPLSALATGKDLPALQRWLDGGPLPDGVARMRRSDGSVFRAALACGRAPHDGGPARLLLVRDLSEPERMREALVAGNQELQAMARRLFSAQEDERRAISRELHDDIGQAITAMKLSAHAAMAEEDGERLREDLQDIAATADATLEKLRNLSMLLRPPQLDALGLEAALRWHAGILFRSTAVALELDIRSLPRRPEREVEQACFRIAQEALTNALRHAGARAIVLALRDQDGRSLCLVVDDDGCGFEPARARGLGLAIMRERAQSAGGRLQIDTGPGQGTRIRLQLPYGAQAEAG